MLRSIGCTIIAIGWHLAISDWLLFPKKGQSDGPIRHREARRFNPNTHTQKKQQNKKTSKSNQYYWTQMHHQQWQITVDLSRILLKTVRYQRKVVTFQKLSVCALYLHTFYKYWRPISGPIPDTGISICASQWVEDWRTGWDVQTLAGLYDFDCGQWLASLLPQMRWNQLCRRQTNSIAVPLCGLKTVSAAELTETDIRDPSLSLSLINQID